MWIRFLAVVAVGGAALLANAKPASAGTVYWSFNCPPATWCEYTGAHDYYATTVSSPATFNVSTATKFIFTSDSTDADEAAGNWCPNCVFSPLLLSDYYIPGNTLPLVYNFDKTYYRNFSMISYYY
jgi:hypothetical protein